MVEKSSMIFRALFLLVLFHVSLAAQDEQKTAENNENSYEAIAQNPNHPDYVFVTWNNSEYLTKAAVDEAVKKLMADIVRKNSNVKISGPCMAAFFRAFQAIRRQTPWAYTCMYSLILVFEFLHYSKNKCDNIYYKIIFKQKYNT